MLHVVQLCAKNFFCTSPRVRPKSLSLHYRLVFLPFEFYIEHFVPDYFQIYLLNYTNVPGRDFTICILWKHIDFT